MAPRTRCPRPSPASRSPQNATGTRGERPRSCRRRGGGGGISRLSPGRSVPTVLSLPMRQVSGPSWIMRREVRSRLCGGGGQRAAVSVAGTGRPPPNPPGSWGYLELGSQGVAGPLQRGGVQAFLVALQAVPVLRLLHGLVHVLEDVPALVPGSAQLVVLRGARWDGGAEPRVRRRWMVLPHPSVPAPAPAAAPRAQR